MPGVTRKQLMEAYANSFADLDERARFQRLMDEYTAETGEDPVILSGWLMENLGRRIDG